MKRGGEIGSRETRSQKRKVREASQRKRTGETKMIPQSVLSQKQERKKKRK